MNAWDGGLRRILKFRGKFQIAAYLKLPIGRTMVTFQIGDAHLADMIGKAVGHMFVLKMSAGELS